MSANPVLNHILSFAKTDNIDNYIKLYKKLGFDVTPTPVRHAPGLKNRFVYFGPDYIEFLWVEDRKKFTQESTKKERDFEKLSAPYGIALKHNNLDALRNKLIKAGLRVPPTWSKTMIDHESEGPWWRFLNIGSKYSPGAYVFYITYLKSSTKKREVTIPKNGIFAMSGISFVSQKPSRRAIAWAKLLQSETILGSRGSWSLITDTHHYHWHTSTQFQKRYGSQFFPKKSNTTFQNEIALIHVYTENLKKTEAFFKQRRLKVHQCEDGIIVRVSNDDMYTFHITEKDPRVWVKARRTTDSTLTLAK